MAELDSKDMITYINRESPRQFTLWLNGIPVKTFKKRDSANQYLVRLWKKIGGGNFHTPNTNNNL